MFEEVPQELKDSVAEVLVSAAEEAQGLLDKAQEVLDEVAVQINEWASDLSAEKGGTQDKPLSPQEKYDYILSVATDDYEKTLFTNLKEYLLNDVDTLDAIYESKVQEKTGPFEAQWGEGWWDTFKEKD